MNEKEIKKYLAQCRDKVKPSDELARKILANLNLQKQDKKSVSVFGLFFKWKFLVPAAIVVLLVVVWGIGRFSPISNVPLVTTKQEQFVQVPPEVAVPDATGQIDDTIDALIALSLNEQTVIVEEGNDALMVTIDSQAISDLGQSYNETDI